MPAALLLIGRFLLSPLWLLWRLYLVLWWAFNEEGSRGASPSVARPSASTVVVNIHEDPTSDGKQRATQDTAVEAIDTTPASRPIPALKLGFAFSLLGSALLAWVVNAAGHHQFISSSGELRLWLWASCVAFVVSLWPVRHIARRQQAEPPKNWRDHAGCIAGGVKDSSVAAYARALEATDLAVGTGRRVWSAATRWAEGARRLWGRAARRTG
jgi:hypothetical protein